MVRAGAPPPFFLLVLLTEHPGFGTVLVLVIGVIKGQPWPDHFLPRIVPPAARSPLTPLVFLLVGCPLDFVTEDTLH